MTRIHDKEVNKKAECSLLHDIINPSRQTQKLNIHYSSILQICMNTRKGKEKFKKCRILFDIGCSSTVVMGSLIEKYIQRNTL